jgi:hypothetical protein
VELLGRRNGNGCWVPVDALLNSGLNEVI